MEINKGYTKINTNINIKPKNIELIGININNLVVIKYFIQNTSKYH